MPNPGPVKLLRPRLALAPGPVITYLELRFTGLLPIAVKKVFPVGSEGSKQPPPEATPVATLNAPGPPLDWPTVQFGSSQSAKTSDPARPEAKGLTDARSPAVSRLPSESIHAVPGGRDTGYPLC